MAPASSWYRPVSVVLVAVLGVAAYAFLMRESSEVVDGEVAEAPAERAPVAAPVDTVGLPMDPLPEAMPVPAADPDAAAGTLARAVMTGGTEALPALLTALSMSGFAVYGPDDQVAVRPQGADEGLFFEAWQARAMAGAAGSRKHVSVPLSWLAAGVAAAVPSLKDQPITQRLADGIVESANSDDQSLRFWARFIIELGKQPHAYGSYDLLTRPDVEAVRLDGMQLALVSRRLAAVFGSAPGTTAARAAWPRRLFAMPVVHATEPCAPTGPRPRPTASRSAFRQLFYLLTTPGRALDQLFHDSIANNMDYAMLMLMLGALQVDVEMENGPPLRRTKTTTAGEPRSIRATVSLDGVPLEWFNCYRAWLNSRGRELRSYPRANGPVPNVAVEFDLDGGEIVRIPTSAPAAERGLPGATKTDSQGRARLAVEGAPQSRNLSQPREQRKTAAVTVSAIVKMSDLLTRSHPTDGPASLDLSHDWVTRQDFQIDVPYPFEVIDWSDGPGRWTGTIKVVETLISETSGQADRGAHTIQDTETTQVTVQVTDTTSEHAMSALLASLKGRVEGRYRRLQTFAGWTKQSCGQIANRTMNNTSRETWAGSGEADAVISVNVFEDGGYLIGASSDGFAMPITGDFRGELEVFRSGGQGCTVAVNSESRSHAPTERRMGGMIQVNGRVDPANPNVLSGSRTEERPSGSGGARSKHVKTTTWEFRRQ